MVAALFEAAGAVRQQGDLVASSAGQSLARWEVLYILGDTPASAARVARRLGRTRQSVQRVIDLLQPEGLIAAARNPDNRRSPLFHLSHRGRSTLVAINAAAAEWHRMVMADFDVHQLHRLTAQLQRISELAHSWTPQPERDE